MIVPQHWAEGRVQHRMAGKQITIRRYGCPDNPMNLEALGEDWASECFPSP